MLVCRLTGLKYQGAFTSGLWHVKMDETDLLIEKEGCERTSTPATEHRDFPSR